MKLHALSIFTLVAFLSVSCQPDAEREKEAIMAVLEAESNALVAGDFESFKTLHSQNEQETRVEMGVYGYNVIKGWDRVADFVGDFMESGPHEDIENIKENCIVHVSGKSAWVTCDNVWIDRSAQDEILYNNLQIAFLEKQGNAWKISFSAYYTKGDQNEMTIH